MLNFGAKEKAQVKAVMAQYAQKETKTVHEEARCIMGESTVTLYTSGRVTIQGKDAEMVKEKLLAELNLDDELVLGIDESGRGESFGSMTLAGVLARKNDMLGLRDSKKVKNFEERVKLITRKALSTVVLTFSAEYIDELRKKGFNLNDIEAHAINVIAGMQKDGKVKVRVDGTPLKGVEKGIEFLIKGDDLDPVIGAASILAKYARDTSGDDADRKTWNGETHRPKKTKN